MSLNQGEVKRTSEELHAHFEAVGLTRDELGARAGLSAPDVDAVLAMSGASPVAVWAVRDVLDAAVKSAGVDVAPWSVLTDSARIRALQWFPLKDIRR